MEWFRISPQRLQERFMGYTASFDPCGVIRAHAVGGLQPREGRLTNFLGTVVDPAYFGMATHRQTGTVEEVPIPGNWHACVAEWGACLRALDLASDSFTVVELGCGWACWLNNLAVAARNSGRSYELVGVEGDRDHLAFAEATLQENGIALESVTLHTGIAAARKGVALFPRQNYKHSSWGLKPVFGATESQRAAAIRAGSHEALPMLSLECVLDGHAKVDLLHLDIQGGEHDLLAGSLPILAEKVAYLFVATHSRRIEKSIRRIMPEDTWTLEMERPAIYKLQLTGPRLKYDGVMAWRNRRLLPE